ncbi:MAG: hypothetical protein ACTS5I_11585 [Rhodanobacter sp.]
MTIDMFIQRLLVLYGPPESVDDAAFIDEYRDMLEGVEPAVLKSAGDILRNTHEKRSWPTPAEVRRATSAAALVRPRAGTTDELGPEDFERVGPEDERYVKAVTSARVDAPAYARIIEKRGWIKVRKEPDGPRKRQVAAVVSDITKRMTGERD